MPLAIGYAAYLNSCLSTPPCLDKGRSGVTLSCCYYKKGAGASKKRSEEPRRHKPMGLRPSAWETLLEWRRTIYGSSKTRSEMAAHGTRLRGHSHSHGPVDLRVRLESRRPELEQAVLTRVSAIADPAEGLDPAYVEGQRTAVSAAVDYGLSVIRVGAQPPQVPVVLFAQARLAARVGVSLDTVLRRYAAGYALFGDLVIEEAEAVGVAPGELKRLHGAQAAAFDRLLAAVGEEYGREIEMTPASSARRRFELVERLLAGELVETAELRYDLDAWHVGIVVIGNDAAKVLGDLSGSLDCRLLLVEPDDRRTWAWLGCRRQPDLEPLTAGFCAAEELRLRVAIGEPGEGISGWRVSHRQAAAAIPISPSDGANVVRYADVALLASMRRDDLLATSLRQIYLVPLEDERKGGEQARQTLRAYFAADRNVSSTAAALGISRNTVTSRLQAIEERLERPLPSCAVELEAALRLDELASPDPAGTLGNQ